MFIHGYKNPVTTSVVRLAVDRNVGSGGRRPAGWMAGGEDREKTQPDVLLAAFCLWLHHHHRSAERVDAVRGASAHGRGQRCDITGRTGKTPTAVLIHSCVM